MKTKKTSKMKNIQLTEKDNTILQTSLNNLEKKFSEYAGENVKISHLIDEVKITETLNRCTICFKLSELAMYRIAEKMKKNKNLSYGYSIPFKSHYIIMEYIFIQK